MSKRKLPNYRSKQKILYIDATSPSLLIGYGDQYLEQQAFADALDFYAKAEHTAGIEKISSLALEKGDVFLYSRALRALDREADPKQWRQIIQRAVDLGKFAFARQALLQVDDPSFQSAIDDMIKTKEADKRT